MNVTSTASIPKAISEITRILISKRNFTDALADALKYLSHTYDYDLAFVFQNVIEQTPKTPTSKILLRSYYSKLNDSSILPDRQSRIFMYSPKNQERLAQGMTLILPTDELSPFARQFLSSIGIQQLCLIPLFEHETFWGIMGFGSNATQTSISTSEETIFKSMSGVITASFERERLELELADERNRYAYFFESNPAIKMVINASNGKIESINEKGMQFYGYTPDDVDQLTIFDINTSSKEEVEQKLKKAASMNTNHFITEHRRKDGSVLEVEIFSGPVTIKGESFLFSIVHDISEIQTSARQKLQQGQEMLFKFVRDNPSMVCLTEKDGRYLICSPIWHQLITAPMEMSELGNVAELFEDRPKLWSKAQKDTQEEGASRINRFKVQYKDGTYHWFHFDFFPWFTEQIVFAGYLIFAQEVTDTVLANEYRQSIQEQKESLALKINSIEEERKRFSQELHDSVGQILSAIRLNMELLDADIPSDQMMKVVKHTKDLVDRTISELRSFAHALRPSILDDIGLVSAVNSLFDDLSSSPITFKLEENIGYTRFHTEIEISVYRICQEALNNIIKHSNATEANVHFDLIENHLMIHIQDNGSGIDNSEFASKRGLGFRNMRERTELVGGSFSLHTSKEKGTELRLRIPLKETLHHE